MNKKIYFSLLSVFAIIATSSISFAQSPLFESVAHGLETFQFQSSDVGDFDGDGYLDLIICGAIDTSNSGYPDTSFCQLYRNNEGNFEAVENFSVISKHLGDVSFINSQNNGRLDIVITGQDYDNLYEYFTFFYKNTGTSFELTDTFPGYIFSELESADLNQNGRIDLVSNGRSSNATYGPETILYENLGDFNFDRQELPVEATQMMGNMKLVDIDNDNLIDLVLMGMDASFQPVFNIYRNTGDGFFLHQTLEGAMYGSLNYGDFNADGYQDLVINGSMDINGVMTPVTKVFWNDGEGHFTPIDLDYAVNNSSGARSIGTGDLNNDGYYDIIVFGEEGSLNEKTYLYTYNPTTQAFDLYEGATGLMDIGSNANVRLFDFNNDNSLDMLVSGMAYVDGSLEAVTKLYRNNSPITNQVPTPPTQLDVSEDGEYYVFQWSGATDDRTPYEALRYEIRIGSDSGLADLAKYQVTTPSWKIRTDALPAEGFTWAIKSIDASTAHSEASEEAVYGSLGIGDFKDDQWLLYPNPAWDTAIIQGENLGSYKLYSQDGKLIQTKNTHNDHSIILDVSELQSGVYHVEITGRNGDKIHKKLIKK